MSNPAQWRFHVGAHKTATTHLQAVLERLAPDLAAQGVAALPMAETRPIGRFRLRAGPPHSRLRDKVRRRFKHAKHLRRLAQGADIAVMSEEDVLGWSQDQLENRFYPDLSGLDVLPMVSGRAPLHVYVSLRSYDTLLPSAFFESYKVFPDAGARLKHGVASALNGTSNWVVLMDRIAKRLPSAKLHFWRQEDYAVAPKPIIDAFVGVDIGAVPDIPRPTQTKSPNANALEAVAALDPNLEMRDRIAKVEAIYASNPREAGPKPALLTPEDITKLQEAYARDIKVLQARFVDIGQGG